MFGPRGSAVGWLDCNLKSKEQSKAESALGTLGGGKGDFEMAWGAWVVS